MCDELGFNTVRLWLNFDVYYKEPEEFMQTLEQYISLCAKHNQSVMLVLAYEEDLPDGAVSLLKTWARKRFIIIILTGITSTKSLAKRRVVSAIISDIPS